MLCWVLGVSPSDYWAWRKRAPSARARANEALTDRIVTIHANSRQTYGTPRIQAELAADGMRCGRMRLARLTRLAGVVGCHRRRGTVTTRRDPAALPAPDLVSRQFVAQAPNTRWTAETTQSQCP